MELKILLKNGEEISKEIDNFSQEIIKRLFNASDSDSIDKIICNGFEFIKSGKTIKKLPINDRSKIFNALNDLLTETIDEEYLIRMGKSSPIRLVNACFDYAKQNPDEFESEIQSFLDTFFDGYKEMFELDNDLYPVLFRDAFQSFTYELFESMDIIEEIEEIFKTKQYVKEFGMEYSLEGDGFHWIAQLTKNPRIEELFKEIIEYFMDLYSQYIMNYITTGEWTDEEIY